MKVGTLRGIFILAKYGKGLALQETSSFETAFSMLASGRVEAVMLQQVEADGYLQMHPVPGIARWPHVWAEDPLSLVLNKKHADLVPRLDTALQQMKRDGVLDLFVDAGLREHHIEPLPSDERRAR